VQQARFGDNAAFEELVRRTSRLVYARLFLETGDTHLAEDLLQETLMIAFRTIHQLSHPDRFRAWLLRIAQNVAIDAGRRQTRHHRTIERESLNVRLRPVAGPSPHDAVEQEDLLQRVLVILRAMPEEYRLPLTMHYLVGADHQTIQLQMGITNGALRGLLHRGMQRLRAELKKVIDDPVPARV
jgi:RNA polymerase sigma-70 factor (ECF subfamily)